MSVENGIFWTEETAGREGKNAGEATREAGQIIQVGAWPSLSTNERQVIQSLQVSRGLKMRQEFQTKI